MRTIDARPSGAYALRCVLAVIALAVMVGLFFVLYRSMWSPEFVRWTRNGYAMVQADVWTGWLAIQATCAHWFIKLYGRTVITLLMVVICLFGAGRLFQILKR